MPDKNPPAKPAGVATIAAPAIHPAAGAPGAPAGAVPGAPGAPPVRRHPGHRGADVRDTVAEMAAKAQEISMEAGSKMAAAMKDVINAAAGITSFAIESSRDLVQYMVRRGQMTQDEADKLIREAEDTWTKKHKGKKPPARVHPLPSFKSEAKLAVTAVFHSQPAAHVATASVRPATPAAHKPTAVAKPAAKSAGKHPAKTGAKKAAPAKKAGATGKKAAAKKAPAKKAPAKASAKKASAKSSAKKPAAKKKPAGKK